MIKDSFVIIKTKGNAKYLTDEKFDSDEITVPISSLRKSSRQKINTICDICQKELYIEFNKYNASVSKGGLFSCSRECAIIKRKKTNLEKYGVELPIQSDVIQEKIKKTNLERYGHEFSSSSDKVKSKIKSTNLKKYGVENVFESNDIKEKIKKTNLEKYGVFYPTMSEEIKMKIKDMNLERYGGTGFESKLIRQKIENNLIEKYGHTSVYLSEKFRISKFEISNDLNYIEYLSNNKSLFSCEVGHTYSISSDNYRVRKKRNLPLCTVCYPISEHRSIKEKEIFEFIKNNYKGEIISNYRDILEIDIYIPDLKIGFEFNGLYWHSEEFKYKRYHIDKTNFFKERGIRIIHIWEDILDKKSDILKSQIKNWLNLTKERFFARKCRVEEVNKKEAKKFINDNHIQGYLNSVYNIGLYYNNELVSLMSFDKFEGRKKLMEREWNLNRFCNKLNTNVVGGASKLIGFFIKKNNPNRIISYSDNDWSNGGVYKRLGFQLVSSSNPDYKYIVDGVRIHKSNFKKSILEKKKSPIFSERDVVEKLGHKRIYDCGKSKYELQF